MVGGAIGTLARYVVSVLALPVSRDLPWGTIGINVTGKFVLGCFGTLTWRFPVFENHRLFVMIGLCGGWSTRSLGSRSRRANQLAIWLRMKSGRLRYVSRSSP